MENCQAIEAALPQEHKDTLANAGLSVADVIAWLKSHAAIFGHDLCAVAPMMEQVIPLIPGLSPAMKTAFVTVLAAMCPQSAPAPAPAP